MSKCVPLVSVFLSCGQLYPDMIETTELQHTIRTECKEWDVYTYFDVGALQWVSFEWCSEW